MRKIESRYVREKKRRRNQIIVGIVLVVVMVFSTLGFALQSGGGSVNPNGNGGNSGNTITYNGYEFVNQNGLWILDSFVFKYTPQQAQQVQEFGGFGSGLKNIQGYQGLPLYIYSESDEAEIEISVNLGQVAERVQNACPEGDICENENLPVKTCNDNFIIIKESNNTRIEQENNCVYIEGGSKDLIRLADQFLFKTLGIQE